MSIKELLVFSMAIGLTFTLARSRSKSAKRA